MPDTRAETVTPSAGMFPSGFDLVSFILRPSLDKFDVAAMERYFHENFTEPDVPSPFERNAWYHLIIPPRNEETGEYHVHLDWLVSDEAMEIRIGYYPKAAPHAPDERDPFAEDVMRWLGKFFKYESVQATMLGSFTYPLAERQSRFILPLKIDLGSGEAEIDGISLNLAHKPDGVFAIRLTQGITNWLVDTIGETRIVFNAFSPHEGPSGMARVVSTILEERAPCVFCSVKTSTRTLHDA